MVAMTEAKESARHNSLWHCNNSLECSAGLLHSARTGKTYVVRDLELVRAAVSSTVVFSVLHLRY